MAFKRTIRRLPKDPGVSGWRAILPVDDAASVLKQNLRADWLIIGAGFAGMACARELTLRCPGSEIVLLDAVRLGEGPAGRNSGFMIDLPHDLSSESYTSDRDRDCRQIVFNRHAIDFATRAADAYGFSKETFDLCGKINGAATVQGLQYNTAFARHLTAIGEDYRHLDADAMASLTGSDYYRGGLYTPGTAMIQPARFIRAMAVGLAGSIHLFENSPVVGLATVQGGWLAQTPAGTVQAPKVVLAVNGHVQNFGFFKRRLMHVFTYASMTRSLRPAEIAALGGTARWSVTPANPMGTTVRRLSGSDGERLVIRNCFSYDPRMEVSARRLQIVKHKHLAAFKSRFPSLAQVEMAHTWGGRLCLSKNNVHAFGEVEPGLYSACCQNGLGAARGTFAGIMAARLAARVPCPVLDRFLVQEQPQPVPPEPLAWIGANAYLRWKEWRAGAEF